MVSPLYVIIPLLLLGTVGLLLAKNIIKLVIALSIFEGGLFLLAVGGAYIANGSAALLGNPEPLVNPIPQALTLTAIVIGASITALTLSIMINLYQHIGSIELDDLTELRG